MGDRLGKGEGVRVEREDGHPEGRKPRRHSGMARRARWLKLKLEEEGQASGWAKSGGAGGLEEALSGWWGCRVMFRLTNVSLSGGVMSGLGHEL